VLSSGGARTVKVRSSKRVSRLATPRAPATIRPMLVFPEPAGPSMAMITLLRATLHAHRCAQGGDLAAGQPTRRARFERTEREQTHPDPFEIQHPVTQRAP